MVSPAFPSLGIRVIPGPFRPLVFIFSFATSVEWHFVLVFLILFEIHQAICLFTTSLFIPPHNNTGIFIFPASALLLGAGLTVVEHLIEMQLSVVVACWWEIIYVISLKFQLAFLSFTGSNRNSLRIKCGGTKVSCRPLLFFAVLFVGKSVYQEMLLRSTCRGQCLTFAIRHVQPQQIVKAIYYICL